MRKSFLIAVVAGILFTAPAFAHEGHNHDAPTTIKAPRGGVIKALDESRVEVVYKGEDIKIYVYDKNMKPTPSATFKITAKAELPRKKTTDDVPFTAKEMHFEGAYDAKGAHRYTLKLAVTDSRTGHTENLTFTIEPRK